MSNGDRKTFLDSNEAMLCLKDNDQGELTQQLQQQQISGRQHTPIKQQRTKKQVYYTPKWATSNSKVTPEDQSALESDNNNK